MTDNINPQHYRNGDIECIEAIRAALTPDEFRGYCKGNAIKYVWRERMKGGNESLQKANWYMDKAVSVSSQPAPAKPAYPYLAGVADHMRAKEQAKTDRDLQKERECAFWSIGMIAAASLEDASYYLRDKDAKRCAVAEAGYVRKALNALRRDAALPAATPHFAAVANIDGFVIAILNRLGSGAACGGLDVDQTEYHSTTQVVLRAIDDFEARLKQPAATAQPAKPSPKDGRDLYYEAYPSSEGYEPWCGLSDEDQNDWHAKAKEQEGGWIEWKGGECPVSRGTIIQAKLRDGSVSRPIDAHTLRWSAAISAGDIIAYRITKEQS